MKVFVTGGTGFIGAPLVRKLVARGYDVHALVRSQEKAAALEAAGAHPVWGDICDRESMRPGMQGAGLVFHVAGWYKVGQEQGDLAERVNVEGTRNVLELAAELEVMKIVYVSTVAVYGHTHGELVDETLPIPNGPFLTEYDRTKWIAHTLIAQPLMAKGIPIVITLPGAAYGPGDPSLVGELLRFFSRVSLPAFAAGDLTLTLAHVDDIAEGLLLAGEKGRTGESYILAGDPMSLQDLLEAWSEVTGRARPSAYLPSAWIRPLAPPLRLLQRFLRLPAMVSADTAAMAGATYLARADKARMELGWVPRPVRAGLEQTWAEMAAAQRTASEAGGPAEAAARNRARRAWAGAALGVAAGVLLAWLLLRPRR